MIEKVVLTKRQADMIESHKGHFETLMDKRLTDCCPTYLDDVSVEDVARAYFYGYEVKEEHDWWTRQGRKVWELREGDCLISKHDKHSCQVKFVEVSDETSVLLVDGIQDEFYEGEHDLQTLKDKYVVFCFAEDRKDVNMNDKEQLEEIEEIDEEVSNGFAIEDLDLNTMTVVNRQHFEWLKEQAKQNNDYREAVEEAIKDLENECLWDALIKLKSFGG